MSGSALSPWALTRQAADLKAQVARLLNCPLDSAGRSADTADIGECLRSKSLAELLHVDVRAPCRFCASFAPFVDGAVIQVYKLAITINLAMQIPLIDRFKYCRSFRFRSNRWLISPLRSD